MLAAFAVPASAPAATHWYYNRQLIPVGERVEVPTSTPDGDVHLKPAGDTTIEFDCAITGRGIFSNTETQGIDSTPAISFACPAGDAVTALGLPWSSTLVEASPTLHDPWEGVELEVVHAGTDYGVFAGSLDTTVGDVDGEHEREAKPGEPDEADSYLTFRGGADDGPLLNRDGVKLWLAGHYHLGTKSGFITDESGVL
jgi:hypothetical protein